MQQSKFMGQLMALARMANRDMAPEAFELFEALVLEPYGEDAARRALSEFVRGAARGFPMPGELIALIEGPQITPKQIASEAAGAILGAIARRGYTWTDTFRYDGFTTFEEAVRAELGEMAIGVLNICGGWQRFCQQFDEGVNSNVRAQLRDLLEVQTIRAQRNERLALAPARQQGDAIGEFIGQQKALRAKSAKIADHRSVIEPMDARVRDEDLPF